MAISEAHELAGNFSELIFEGHDPAIVWPAMLRRLEQSIGFDAGYIAASFGASTEGRGAVLEHDVLFLKQNLGRFLAQISAEEVARYTDRARAHVDVWTKERQRGLAVFQEVLVPTAMRHMAVRVSLRMGNVAGFNLERRGGSSPFAERELNLIDLVGPFLHIVEILNLELADEQATASFSYEYRLSHREAELVDLVARGLQNGEIALLVGLSPNTVRNTLARVFEKVGVSNRAELTFHATRINRERDTKPTNHEPGSSRDDGTALFARRVQEAATRSAAPPSGIRQSSMSQIVYTPPLARVPA